jgi:hypothetical protein
VCEPLLVEVTVGRDVGAAPDLASYPELSQGRLFGLVPRVSQPHGTDSCPLGPPQVTQGHAGGAKDVAGAAEPPVTKRCGCPSMREAEMTMPNHMVTTPQVKVASTPPSKRNMRPPRGLHFNARLWSHSSSIQGVEPL